MIQILLFLYVEAFNFQYFWTRSFYLQTYYRKDCMVILEKQTLLATISKAIQLK